MGKVLHSGAVGALVVALCVPGPAAAVERVERGNLVLEGIPEIPPALVARLEQYQNTRSAGLAGWLPGGGMLIRTRFGDTSQIHRVDRPGGARTQLTFFSEPVGGGAPSPNPEVDRFLFTRDVGGSEFFQIYSFDLQSGASTLLTDGSSRNGAAVWSNDGKRFAFFTTRRNGRDYDIHVADIAVRERVGRFSSARVRGFPRNGRRTTASCSLSTTCRSTSPTRTSSICKGAS